ncbi:histone-fold-containing protein [Podospora appendiculata]|uniref:DNA polymerase epsilon subunit D n=1 Tax=Podospora appendiculata TaxID=314037 RepID=A0AAE1CH24_9PEZI|nr:histone-fold-containing protein [Podospora appendiculata]
MPARKSDSRRSDVSVARFVLAEEENAAAMSAGPHAAAPPAPAAPAETPEASASPSRTDLPAERQRSTPGKKDKESEKERERERERDVITIEDLTLPKSIITRLAKGVLPPNTQIQANAILAMSKSAVVFISHLANASNELTLNSNKKTIMPADVFKALDDIEYGFMRERLEAEFAKFNEVQTSKRSSYRKKVAAKKKGVSSADDTNVVGDSSLLSTGSHDDDDDDDDDGDDDTQRSLLQADPGAPPRAKKARVGGDSLDASRMDLDGGEPSDAETVPDEPEEEEEEEEDEDEAEEEEDGEEGGEEEEEEEEEEEGDEIDERAGPDEDEDEALDGDESE